MKHPMHRAFAKAHVTHSMLHFHCDIVTILHCIQADILLAFLWQKSHAQKYPSVYLRRNSSHVFFMPKTLFISMKKQFLHQKKKTVHTAFECTTTMREALIALVHQYPVLWDKQDTKYKDSNYKNSKWKEIAEMLCLTKDDVKKKWKSLTDTFMKQKNIKSESRDGLSD